jgi:hypothetical protein
VVVSDLLFDPNFFIDCRFLRITAVLVVWHSEVLVVWQPLSAIPPSLLFFTHEVNENMNVFNLIVQQITMPNRRNWFLRFFSPS